MRRLLVILGLIAAGVLTAMYLLYSSLNDIVEAAIERVGSDITQTAVRLDDVTLSPDSGQGVLRGFRITNPQGFDSSSALTFETASVVVDVTTLAGDPVVIEEIVIDRPQITYELGPGRSNFTVLEDNANRFEAEASDGEAERRGFVIKRLRLVDGTVTITASGSAEPRLSGALPDIALENIGTGGDGATARAVVSQLLSRLSAAVVETLAKLDLEAIGQEARDRAVRGGDGLMPGGGEARALLERLLKAADQ